MAEAGIDVRWSSSAAIDQNGVSAMVTHASVCGFGYGELFG